MKKLIVFCAYFYFTTLCAQDLDSIMSELDGRARDRQALPAFKSPKLVLLQTNETQTKQELSLWIGHRFGDIGGEFGGSHRLFGLDEATDIHIGLDYGISEDLTVGIGRSRFNETYHLQAKYAIVRQRETGMPVSITGFAQSGWITRRPHFEDEFPDESDRISYFFQIIFAKRFHSRFSFMISPGYLLRPIIHNFNDKEDFFVTGLGGRFRITNGFSIIADYLWVKGLDRPVDFGSDYYNPLGIGLEIQTGGHVFSLNFQNATYITQTNFIPHTRKSWSDGEVRFGFTITRDFYLGPKNEQLPAASSPGAQ